jgi:hypothetical protein
VQASSGSRGQGGTQGHAGWQGVGVGVGVVAGANAHIHKACRWTATHQIHFVLQ